jgi:energy-coupling factor transporter ATP-binding protein EcfA2
MNYIELNIEKITIESKYILGNISFNLKNGELLIITGNSGSGKSTLLNYISGIYDKNHLCVLGGIKKQDGLKVSYVSQNPESNIVSNNVLSELLLSSNENIDKINELVKKFSLTEEFLESNTNSLSGGQIQVLAILCGFLQNADVFILDEPTSMLDNENSMIVIEVIKEMLNQNKSFIISTHNCKDFDFASNRIALPSNDIESKDCIFDSTNKISTSIEIEIKNIDFYYKKQNILFNDFSLSLSNGDILLLNGKNGSGKTTLAKLLAGILKPKKGKILINGIEIDKQKKYLPVYFSYSLQNPNWQLLFSSVTEEIFFCSKKYSKKNDYSTEISNVLRKLKINGKEEPRVLSFGQKKFVSNFSYLHKPSVHFFDEPDLGMDSYQQEILYRYIKHRQDLGLISIIVSHHSDSFKELSTKTIAL